MQKNTGRYNITVLEGDGIGPEIVAEAVKALYAISENSETKFDFNFKDFGGAAIDSQGEPYPEDTKRACESADAILLGAIGGDKWDGVDPSIRPEKGLLNMRKHIGTYCNLRPIKTFKSTSSLSPLKESIIGDGIDFTIVRELTGGIYFGEKKTIDSPDSLYAYDMEIYHKHEISRILKTATEIARKRDNTITIVDKANVLESSKLWRKISKEVIPEDITVDYMYVDNASMQIIRKPSQFTTMVTSNMFGDILSDEASVITGSIGMLPSASLGENSKGIYEPIHGSAPDIAGQNIANPVGTILSAAMMLKYSFNMDKESTIIETAVENVLDRGIMTIDLSPENYVSTSEFGDMVSKEIYSIYKNS
ncbi:MAG: 3-isopropylmalate dehydrogenase [Firmicutes bacterium]|jgi:3-isopropylmalate dehydrogenase|nr:3-isopropylmalate dehydrogenase [Bacillota bacterium]